MNLCKTRIRRPRFAPHVSYDLPQLCASYGLPKLTPTKAAPIAVISLGGGLLASDIATAFAKWGLPAPRITFVSVQGAVNSPGDDADAENALDVQVSGAAFAYCTGRPADIRFYSAPNTDSGFAAAVTQAAADGCKVISISWGAPESSWGNAISQFTQACAKAKAMGATIFAASGDNGSGDGLPGAHVDYPASDPSVVGCGGTTKTSGAETVWADTGGGYSAVFPRQAFQVGAPVGGGRMVPDVAANADPQTGYRICVNGSWGVIGGTSAVAPLYSGLTAALLASGASAGDVATAFWQHPAAFADVTSGNNGKWRAQAGPDPCTGLGVVKGGAILAALGGALPPPVSPPPVLPPVPGRNVIVIDLDSGTYSFPPSFHPAAEVAGPERLGDGKLLAVGFDGLRIFTDARSGNAAAVMADVQQLLKDVGALFPTPTTAAA